MTAPEIKYGRNSTVLSGSLALVRRYPLRTASAIGSAIWLLLLALYGQRWLTLTALVAWAATTYRGVKQYVPPEPEPEPPIDPQLWLAERFHYAHLTPPLFLRDYPTAKGHAFYVVVTLTDTDGRPMTVSRFSEFGGLLRDVIGVGCTGVEIEADPAHGGRATIYVNGIRFTEPEPEPVAVPKPRCHVRGCQAAPTMHIQLSGDLERTWVLCDIHADGYAGRAVHLHPLTDACLTGCLPDHEEADREREAPPAPLLPLHIRDESQREGSGVWEAPDPTRRVELQPLTLAPGRPIGAEEGTKGGLMWDHLTSAGIPVSRRELADAADLSITTTSRLLGQWRDAGCARSIAGLWIATVQHPTSGTLTRDGREEAAGE